MPKKPTPAEPFGPLRLFRVWKETMKSQNENFVPRLSDGRLSSSFSVPIPVIWQRAVSEPALVASSISFETAGGNSVRVMILNRYANELLRDDFTNEPTFTQAAQAWITAHIKTPAEMPPLLKTLFRLDLMLASVYLRDGTEAHHGGVSDADVCRALACGVE